MTNIQRKLVTIRTIDEVNPIEGADTIEVVTIGGWKVVTKKDEFKAGSLCVYFEIDSFLPTGNPAWQFLVDKQSRTFEGVVGHRLRTVKLRGQVSQGFVLPLQVAIDAFVDSDHDDGAELCEVFYDGADVTDIFGIKKWEQPLPAALQGQAEGLFPSFIRKTDQERCQNMVAEIFGYDDQLVDFSITAQTMTPEALTAMQENGVIEWVDGRWMKILRARADRNAKYEVTMKMDGSSMTIFARQRFTEPVQLEDGTFFNHVETGVCSRNLQLKVNGENAENTFVKLAVQSGLLTALDEMAQAGSDYAIQGELMGPGIQGNREQLKDFKFFIFDVQDLIDNRYLTPDERKDMVQKLLSGGVNADMVKHVPTLYSDVTLDELGIKNVKELLAFAEGPSIVHPVREGLVFKRMDGRFSFKAISQKYLIAERD